jgi:chemotaxis protein methyltransferase CheR
MTAHLLTMEGSRASGPNEPASGTRPRAERADLPLPSSRVTRTPEDAVSPDPALQSLLEAIYRTYHDDFRGYALPSLRRRITQALVVLDLPDAAELERRILDDPATFAQLRRYLTVQVSDLFRDPPYWRAFRERVVPVLRTYPSLKLWVPGCSTGEEALSFAIVLREEGLLDRSMIYGTDIHSESLERAAAGLYALDRLALFTEGHRRSGAPGALSDHYQMAHGAAIFDRSLYRRLVFADHSLATDAVFSEVQVVSCRNVLIYFGRALQARALSLFRESLCCRGFLGLGARETLHFSPHAGAFTELGSEARWHRRTE